MKLYHIGWETDEGRELVEEVACDHQPTKDEARQFIVQEYKLNWGDEFSKTDVFNIYIYAAEKTSAIGTSKRYRIKLEEITPDNCDHADYTENMDGSGKCLDCGLEKPADEDEE